VLTFSVEPAHTGKCDVFDRSLFANLKAAHRQVDAGGKILDGATGREAVGAGKSNVVLPARPLATEPRRAEYAIEMSDSFARESRTTMYEVSGYYSWPLANCVAVAPSRGGLFTKCRA
jgi:hypothetical protein